MGNKIYFKESYNNIISIENLLLAWKEFVCGKKKRKDVQVFERNLMDNIILLHNDLITRKYKHSNYEAFTISDPKRRDIHKAEVRDRLLHHALYRNLYPFFDRTFISDSYSCRFGKGTYEAVKTFRKYLYKASYNHKKTVWVLKCDIRKFFANIDHLILNRILSEKIHDKDIKNLLFDIINSFNSTTTGVGLPLGNLTSQLLVNIYMNEFDQFVKHKIKVKYYIRYADDFVVISQDKKWLQEVLSLMKEFLSMKLRLDIHPNKISIRTIASGIDFLGWVHFTNHCVIRTKTKKRMFRNIKTKRGNIDTVGSYLGLLSHGNTKKIISEVDNLFTNVESVNFDDVGN